MSDPAHELRPAFRPSGVAVPSLEQTEPMLQPGIGGSRGGLCAADARALVETWLRFKVLDLTAHVMISAFVASARWRISYWDAAIVEAARALECAVLLTEDMQHGQDFEGVRVVDPFRQRFPLHVRAAHDDRGAQ